MLIHLDFLVWELNTHEDYIFKLKTIKAIKIAHFIHFRLQNDYQIFVILRNFIKMLNFKR